MQGLVSSAVASGSSINSQSSSPNRSSNIFCNRDRCCERRPSLVARLLVLLVLTVFAMANHKHSHAHDDPPSPFYLDLTNPRIKNAPPITAVQIYIGCGINPPMPPANNESIAVIAVEPVIGTANRIPYHDRLFVITCAIADVSGFQTLNLYSLGGTSSSLLELNSRPATKSRDRWYVDLDPREGKTSEYEKKLRQFEHLHAIVPVMPLRMLLKAVPPHIEILQLYTDLQGMDFSAIRSAGRSIRRVRNLRTEVSTKTLPDYVARPNASNSLDSDWRPYMAALGYRLDHRQWNGEETDAYWRRIDG